MKLSKLLVLFGIIFLSQITNSYGLKPIKEYKNTPKDYGLNYTQHQIPDNQDTIVSWYMKPTENRKNITVLLSYGDYGNMSYFLWYAQNLYFRGYDVITYDYVGFGQSSQFETDSNKLFYLDYANNLAAVYNYYNKMNIGQIDFYSLSLGTIATTIFAYNHRDIIPKSTKFVYEGFVYSIDSVIKNLEKKGKLSAPIDDHEYSKMVNALKNEKTFIFVGTQDKVCTLDLDRASKIKNWTIQTFDGGHLTGASVLTKTKLGDEYFGLIDDFLENK